MNTFFSSSMDNHAEKGPSAVAIHVNEVTRHYLQKRNIRFTQEEMKRKEEKKEICEKVSSPFQLHPSLAN
jgi:phenylpyruvate tautomerase PptA (4-oxalocrotonate tautomerase family)